MRRTEKIGWVDRVRSEEVHNVKEKNIIHTKKEANRIVHILRSNCCLIHVIEGNVEGRI